jgi:formylglycine-generating enzyme required for sulfatase activity
MNDQSYKKHNPMKALRFTQTAMALAISALLLLFSFGQTSANNVTISNVSYVANGDSVKFDISWENSWRNTGISGSTQNYDGVWVYVKFRHACADDSLNPSAYKHMWLSTNAANHTLPGGDSLKVGTTTIGGNSRGMGVFIYRSSDGSGTFSATGVRLFWGDKAAQGFAAGDDDWDVRVFAIEMVYIPTGAFYVGDQSSQYTLYKYGVNTPYEITSENALTIGTTSGNLYASSGITAGSLPANYPKGYQAFWTMKYEVTQQQYVDFLNSLTRARQISHIGNTSIGVGVMATANTYVMPNSSSMQYRNGIRCPSTFHSTKPITFFCDINNNGTGGEATDGLMVACNYIGYSSNWIMDWLDWASLRPMTELEFEKICRGSSAVYGGQIAYETPWSLAGNVSSNYTYVSSLINAGAADEAPANSGIGLIHGGGSNPGGPRRVGSTYTASTDRYSAGSSYYGVADMGGNVAEMVFRAYNAAPLLRTDHGDGNPYSVPARPSTWNNTYGYKGGYWAEGYNYFAISDRYYMVNNTSYSNFYTGGRGCRQ